MGQNMESKWESPGKNPVAAQASLAAMTSVSNPVIDLPPSDTVDLPGGLVKGGEVTRKVVVRELTGADEETLSRARQSSSAYHYIDTLIECGTERIGAFDRARNSALLQDMLIGDRNQIVLAIRRATYGDSLTVSEWACPECGQRSNVTFSLSEDVEVVHLDDPAKDSRFAVPLRKGGEVEVRLATGGDERAVVDREGLTIKERDSILLSRCLVSIKDASGREHVAAGFSSGMALSLGMADRNVILREMIKRQPGPRISDVKFTHQLCGKEVSLALELGDLFPDI